MYKYIYIHAYDICVYICIHILYQCMYIYILYMIYIYTYIIDICILSKHVYSIRVGINIHLRSMRVTNWPRGLLINIDRREVWHRYR